MKSTWLYRIKFHSEEQLVRRLQCCKEINQKMVFKKSSWMTTVEPWLGTGQIRSPKQGFIIPRFFSIHFTITGAENIVCYIEDWGRLRIPTGLPPASWLERKGPSRHLNWGLLRTNPAKSRGHGLNLWPLDYNFIALTAQPFCLTVRSEQNSVF